VHTLRHQHRAIMVGIGTVLADDPQLTTRLSVEALDPVKIVVDAQLRMPLTARLLPAQACADPQREEALQAKQRPPRLIILTTTQAAHERRAALRRPGVMLLDCGAGSHVDLPFAMAQLAAMNISSILLEGGGQLNGAMLTAHLIDKIHLLIAPKIVGGGTEAPEVFHFAGVETMAEAIRLQAMEVERLGEDLLITGYPDYGTING
jgi:diaminohydroxyphosphoribosylaminopyrimidine deaminase/5-amino-6-(5-phosphoribosylamino)uracil reductase